MTPFLFVLALALGAGPEIRVSDPAIEPSALTRIAPRIASNGREFLAVWYDDLGDGVRGARLDRDGRPIDATSFPIANRTGKYVTVASDGVDYVVAYDCNGDFYKPKVCLARVLSDSARVTAGATIDKAAYPAIASNGRSYVVATQGPNARFAPIYLNAVEVSRDAATVGTPFTLPTASPFAPEIASDGENYLVVSSAYAQLFGTLISAREVLRAPQQLTTQLVSWGASAFGWSVASNGKGYMVTWQQNVGVKNGYVTELRTRPVALDGTLGSERTIVVDPERTWYPAVAWSGSAYEISYTFSATSLWPNYFTPGEADIHRVAVNESGELTQGPASVMSRAGRESMAAIASNGSTTVVVWERQNRPGAVEIEAQTLGAATPFIVSNSVAWQQSIAGALAGDTTLLAWEEFVGPVQRRELRLQRLDAHGRPLDARGIVVEPSDKDQISPALSNAYIAWIEQDLSPTGPAFAAAKRLGPDGVPSGPVIRLGDAARNARIAIASIASRSLIAWQSNTNHIVGVRAGIDATPFAISPNEALNPTIETDGTDFLVVWQLPEPWRCAFECVPPNSLHSALVTAAGTIGATADIAPANANEPVVTWNGSEYVVFWSGADYDARPFEGVEHFKARRVDRNGVPLYGPPQVMDTVYPLSVKWTGRDYVVAFNKYGRDLFVGRIDAQLNLTDVAPASSAYVAFSRAVLVWRGSDAVLGYQTVGGDFVSRAAARVVSDQFGTTRRRSVGR